MGYNGGGLRPQQPGRFPEGEPRYSRMVSGELVRPLVESPFRQGIRQRFLAEVTDKLTALGVIREGTLGGEEEVSNLPERTYVPHVILETGATDWVFGGRRPKVALVVCSPFKAWERESDVRLRVNSSRIILDSVRGNYPEYDLILDISRLVPGFASIKLPPIRTPRERSPYLNNWDDEAKKQYGVPPWQKIPIGPLDDSPSEEGVLLVALDAKSKRQVRVAPVTMPVGWKDLIVGQDGKLVNDVESEPESSPNRSATFISILPDLPSPSDSYREVEQRAVSSPVEPPVREEIEEAIQTTKPKTVFPQPQQSKNPWEGMSEWELAQLAERSRKKYERRNVEESRRKRRGGPEVVYDSTWKKLSQERRGQVFSSSAPTAKQENRPKSRFERKQRQAAERKGKKEKGKKRR